MQPYVLYALLILLGAFGVYMAIHLGGGQLERRGWPVTRGTVLERGVRKVEQAITQGSTYEAAVKYTYEVGGKRYTGDRAYPPPGYAVGPGPERMQKIVDGLPAEVEVRYNPKDPADSYLLPIPLFLPIAAGAAGILMLLLGSALLIAKLRAGA